MSMPSGLNWNRCLVFAIPERKDPYSIKISPQVLIIQKHRNKGLVIMQLFFIYISYIIQLLNKLVSSYL